MKYNIQATYSDCSRDSLVIDHIPDKNEVTEIKKRINDNIIKIKSKKHLVYLELYEYYCFKIEYY